MPLKKKQNGHLIGAIDIGSNAGRLLIAHIYEYGGVTRIKKLQLVRVPLRLGEEVFSNNRISKAKMTQLSQTIHSFKLLMEAYGVQHFKACATSAMREAENRNEVIAHIKDVCQVSIEIIDGKKEADLILNTFLTEEVEKKHHYLYIDVGGGSTEISLIYNGKKLASQSFLMGTVRTLKQADEKASWEIIKKWLDELKLPYGKTTAIGTGGNINKLYKLSNLNRSNKIILREELNAISKYVASFSFTERVNILDLREDRADVILPASKIYLNIMKYSGVEKMIVPKIGLADGIAYSIYKKLSKDC
jgi:exopolyphosphatase / guanosine-5'-triphosphate,3'-diphosphate pyrophosphatase